MNEHIRQQILDHLGARADQLQAMPEHREEILEHCDQLLDAYNKLGAVALKGEGDDTK